MRFAVMCIINVVLFLGILFVIQSICPEFGHNTWQYWATMAMMIGLQVNSGIYIALD